MLRWRKRSKLFPEAQKLSALAANTRSNGDARNSDAGNRAAQANPKTE